jgi:hypothetical protein
VVVSEVIAELPHTLLGTPPVILQINAVIAFAADMTWTDSWEFEFEPSNRTICVQFNPTKLSGAYNAPTTTYLLAKSMNG